MKITASLTTRVFLACASLVTLALALGVGYLYWRTSRDAATESRSAITESAAIVGEYQASLTDSLSRTARLVADLPKLKAAVETADPPTVQPLADDYRQELGADLLIISGRLGQALARSGTSADARPDTDEASTRQYTTFVPGDGTLLQLFSVPIVLDGTPPDVLGRLTVGYRLDERRAQQLKRLTGTDIAFLTGRHVVAASLSGITDADVPATLEAATIVPLTLGQEDFLGLATPLAAAAGEPGAPTVLVLQSQTAQQQLLATIRRGLAVALVVSVLLAALLSYIVARTMTRPINAVTAAMRDIAATGDLTRKVSITDGTWQDEDAQLLATTFNTLTESIARFQREATQRERLSSLGRLSTVIAHEIRNPLMIIRAALRSLRHPDSARAERDDAIADIDEETNRLNHIVSDVLDFAKPLHFERHAIDLNAICRASVDAAFVDATDTHVALELDRSLPPIVTDAERLRTALVNILTNARQAVHATTGASASPVDLAHPDVRLATRHDTNGAEITIEDRGVGISPEDMTHIFDPYYTTRRAGTGLGLPIAKNIIEGLGGSIDVSSTRGAGTALRIWLPTATPDTQG